jgi:hypothetical protein
MCTDMRATSCERSIRKHPRDCATGSRPQAPRPRRTPSSSTTHPHTDHHVEETSRHQIPRTRLHCPPADTRGPHHLVRRAVESPEEQSACSRRGTASQPVRAGDPVPSLHRQHRRTYTRSRRMRGALLTSAVCWRVQGRLGGCAERPEPEFEARAAARRRRAVRHERVPGR